MKTIAGAALGLLLLGMVTGCGAGGIENAADAPVVKANANIAFMGDSITYGWSLPTTNFGQSGNTTTQMRNRFGQVLGHGYKAVVILGGTNDLRKSTGTLDATVSLAVENLQTMAEEAEAQKILVVLCKIPPLVDFDEQAMTLNAAIEELAKSKGYRLVDYYTPMAGHPGYFVDGIHPNSEGYAVMLDALSKVLPIDY